LRANIIFDKYISLKLRDQIQQIVHQNLALSAVLLSFVIIIVIVINGTST